MVKKTKAQRMRQVRRQKIMIAVGCLVLLLAAFYGLGAFPFQKGKAVHLTEAVLSYQEEVEEACREYGISAYSQLLLAMMQQESGGLLPDVLQCSESPFNTQYAQSPNSITDPSYSIRVGAETLAYCLKEAGCKSPRQKERLKLAIQEYNFGNGYAKWALENYGSYSAENAAEFAENMKQKLGWSSYGDPEYVLHVLQYYTMGW